MQVFLANLSHLVMATVVIGATAALAATGTISGPEALAVIGAAGGFSLGAGAVGSTPPPTTGANPAVPIPLRPPSSAVAPTVGPTT